MYLRTCWVEHPHVGWGQVFRIMSRYNLEIYFETQYHAHIKSKLVLIWYIRYVGGIWFFFHVLQLLSIKFTHKSSVDYQIFDETFAKKQIENQTYHGLITIIIIARLLIS